MTRPPSAGQLRRAAARAFHTRNRALSGLPPLRQPDDGEIPLSPAEVAHALRHGLISRAPAHLLKSAQKRGNS